MKLPTLMRKLIKLEYYDVDEEPFPELIEEFHKQTRIPKTDDWATIGSDEAPYVFYAKAWLSGYRYAKKECDLGGKCRKNH